MADRSIGARAAYLARMKPPRAPKGEKPATTIRMLRRQLSIAQSTIQALQMDRADKEKVIAGYDTQLSESDDECIRLQDRCGDQARELGNAYETIHRNAERLAYLEGYHAKSQEILAVPAPSSYVAGDQSQTDPGQRAGDQENLSPRRQRGERARKNES